MKIKSILLALLHYSMLQGEVFDIDALKIGELKLRDIEYKVEELAGLDVLSEEDFTKDEFSLMEIFYAGAELEIQGGIDNLKIALLLWEEIHKEHPKWYPKLIIPRISNLKLRLKKEKEQLKKEELKKEK